MSRFTLVQRFEIVPKFYYASSRSPKSPQIRAHQKIFFVNHQNCRLWVWYGLWYGGSIEPYLFRNETEMPLPSIASFIARSTLFPPEFDEIDVDDLYF